MSSPSCQQDLVYAAEETTPFGNRFKSLDAVQAFYDSLRDTWWWESSCPDIMKVEVGRARRGESNVGWYERDKQSGRCEFVSDQPSELVVVHELAHVIASYRWKSQSHDPWFARAYLELTYLTRGPSTYHQLMTAFVAGGVDIDAPRFMEPAVSHREFYIVGDAVRKEHVR